MTKRALIFSSGGAKGAWQVGVLKYLLCEKQTNYDIFAGVSVGALNAAFLSMFSTGQEIESGNKLINIWRSIETKSVYKHWKPFGYLHGFWETSLYNSKPLIELVTNNIKAERIASSGKQLRISTLSLTTGIHHIFNERDPEIVNATLASSSFPVLLGAIKFHNQIWTDGGIQDPIKAVIECGAEEIDIVSVYAKKIEPKIIDNINAIKIVKRTIEALFEQILETDISTTLLVNKMIKNGGSLINKKYIPIRIFRPCKPLQIGFLDFDPKKINDHIKLGYNDARFVSAQLAKK